MKSFWVSWLEFLKGLFGLKTPYAKTIRKIIVLKLIVILSLLLFFFGPHKRPHIDGDKVQEVFFNKG